MKRTSDLLTVVLTMPLWLPLAGAVALAVLVASGRPVLYRSARTGKDGVPFGFLKFRTMRDGAGTDEERMTRVGRWLRRMSLDELPQLFQVLSGRMSLVGPRPLPVRYLPRYSSFQARRHEVRPGITGWAQVNGRNAISWERKFELDVWYVDHRSFALDWKILALTVVRTLRAEGINHAEGVTMDEFTGGRVI